MPAGRGSQSADCYKTSGNHTSRQRIEWRVQPRIFNCYCLFAFWFFHVFFKFLWNLYTFHQTRGIPDQIVNRIWRFRFGAFWKPLFSWLTQSVYCTKNDFLPKVRIIYLAIKNHSFNVFSTSGLGCRSSSKLWKWANYEISNPQHYSISENCYEK